MNTSHITFVGRKAELDCFHEIIESARPEFHVLYLQGEGGIGKSKLMDQFQALCLSQKLPYTQIIDLYDTDNQFVIGLTNRLATELTGLYESSAKADKNIRPFAQYFDFCNRARVVHEASSNSEEARGFEQKAEEQFITDFNELSLWFIKNDKHPVLFFDTLDAVKDFGNVYHWLLNVLIPAIKDTIVVLAGRHDLPERIQFTPRILKVSSFILAETEDYFTNRSIRSDELRNALTIQRLHTLSEGNPLLITLVADWLLQNPDAELQSLLGTGDPVDIEEKNRFRHQLIDKVLRLDLPAEYVTVWYMAHIYHRFDARILAWVTEKPLDESTAIINNLSQFPFVKYRSKSQSYQLHDVMRDLVREYVLDQMVDISKSLRRDLSDRMIEYYDVEIDKLSNTSQAHDINVLRSEQLYHQLFVDLDTGFATFKELSEAADQMDNLPFNDLLLSNANWYYGDFNPEQAAIFDMYKGWLAKKLGRLIEAEQTLSHSLSTLTLYKSPEADRVASSLGHTYKELGQFSKALNLYKEARNLNEHSEKDKLERRKAEAQILNNIGNLLRLQGLVDEAHQYSINSLIMRQGLQDSLGLANSYFILGLIVREFGDNNGALQYLDKAEAIYLKIPSDFISKKGKGNVLRIRAYIYNHVREHGRAIELARESCRILLDEVGTPSSDLADSLDIMGRLIRDEAVDTYQNERIKDENSALVLRNEKLKEAESYIERGYLMAKKVGDKFKEAESLLSYVRLFYIQGKYQEALQRYELGISICRPRDYYLLLNYFEFFAGSTYFALEDYDEAFDKFAKRALYAARCRSMEMGMAMDSIASYLQRLNDPQKTSHYAKYLIQAWKQQPDRILEKRFPQMIKMCRDIKRLALL